VLQVTIELLRDLPTATSVSVTPLSPDDWEILVRVKAISSSPPPPAFPTESGVESETRETDAFFFLIGYQESNAEFVETHLLNQVRAVKEGTIVGCWVGGTTLVRFMVGKSMLSCLSFTRGCSTAHSRFPITRRHRTRRFTRPPPYRRHRAHRRPQDTPRPSSPRRKDARPHLFSHHPNSDTEP